MLLVTPSPGLQSMANYGPRATSRSLAQTESCATDNLFTITTNYAPCTTYQQGGHTGPPLHRDNTHHESQPQAAVSSFQPSEHRGSREEVQSGTVSVARGRSRKQWKRTDDEDGEATPLMPTPGLVLDPAFAGVTDGEQGPPVAATLERCLLAELRLRFSFVIPAKRAARLARASPDRRSLLRS